MNEDERAELFDYLDGFMAWDGACRSSGIKHDAKRAEIRVRLWKMAEETPRMLTYLLWKFILEKREDPLCNGSIEDIAETLDWLREFIGSDDWSGL